MVPGYIAEQPKSTFLPRVDVAKVLEEDREQGKRLPRSGIKIPVGFTEKDGQWYERGRTAVWKMRFYSQRATALSFQFRNFHLPEGSEMWLYSEEHNMVMGPILPEYVHEGVFPTDQIFGEEVTIVALMNKGQRKEFKITVKNAIHGIKKTEIDVRDYGDAYHCIQDVNCNIGLGWEKEIAAVCKIFIPSSYFSGTLVNNGCQDFSPYVLTAFHGIDLNEDGVLQTSEVNDIGDWIFRFGYESPTCGGSEPSSWISYSGAELRAASVTSDFALVELDNEIIGNSELAVAGWDRSSSVPNSTTIIHHPAGDVKKITIDGGPSIIDPNPQDSLVSGGHFFRVSCTNGLNGDDGIYQGGSSGSSQFNNNKRIVSTYWGGFLMRQNCNSEEDNWFGRFYNSWTGGGTNSTRLSNWLGGNGNPMTTNTIRVPGIDGDDALCSSNKTYELLNPLAGSSVSWSVSPAGLFSGSTSGTGMQAVLKGGASAVGVATLTFTMTGSSCNPVTLQKTIYIGVPDHTELDVNDDSDGKTLIACGSTIEASAEYNGPVTGWGYIQEYEWNLPNTGSWDIESIQSPLVPFRVVEIDYWRDPAPSSEDVYIRARNTCGWSTWEFTQWSVNDQCSFQVDNPDVDKTPFNRMDRDVKLYPSLVSNEFNIQWENNQAGNFNVTVVDNNGKRVKEFSNLAGNRVTLQVDDIQSGMYFCKIDNEGQVFWQRFIIIN